MMFRKLIFTGGTVVSGLIIATNFENISEKFKTAFSLTHDPLNIVKKWNHDWDVTDGGSSTNKSKATRHLILIRHGQYINMEDDALCKLTYLGQDQAAFTGKRLASYDREFEKIVHSNMTRAKETAAIISKHLPNVQMSVDPDLAEGCPFALEPPLAHYVNSPEMIKADHQRIERAFQRYFHRAPPGQDKDSVTILVCHANVIRYMLCRVLQFPPEGWIRMSLDNASISWVSIRPNGLVAVRCIGNSGFMPPDKITQN